MEPLRQQNTQRIRSWGLLLFRFTISSNAQCIHAPFLHRHLKYKEYVDTTDTTTRTEYIFHFQFFEEINHCSFSCAKPSPLIHPIQVLQPFFFCFWALSHSLGLLSYSGYGLVDQGPILSSHLCFLWAGVSRKDIKHHNTSRKQIFSALSKFVLKKNN